MAVVEKLNPPYPKKGVGANVTGIVGILVAISEDGVALVDYPQNAGAPIPARCTISEAECKDLATLPVNVLLIFENEDLNRPIIIGIIKDQLPGHSRKEQSRKEHSSKVDGKEVQIEQEQVNGNLPHEVTEAEVDGKRVTIDAREEILLKCGKSSILLRKDGKIIIKGSNLISRSSMSNKIKGSSVSIN